MREKFELNNYHSVPPEESPDDRIHLQTHPNAIRKGTLPLETVVSLWNEYALVISYIVA